MELYAKEPPPLVRAQEALHMKVGLVMKQRYATMSEASDIQALIWVLPAIMWESPRDMRVFSSLRAASPKSPKRPSP